jgi:hypothetical protein
MLIYVLKAFKTVAVLGWKLTALIVILPEEAGEVAATVVVEVGAAVVDAGTVVVFGGAVVAAGAVVLGGVVVGEGELPEQAVTVRKITRTRHARIQETRDLLPFFIITSTIF